MQQKRSCTLNTNSYLQLVWRHVVLEERGEIKKRNNNNNNRHDEGSTPVKCTRSVNVVVRSKWSFFAKNVVFWTTVNSQNRVFWPTKKTCFVKNCKILKSTVRYYCCTMTTAHILYKRHLLLLLLSVFLSIMRRSASNVGAPTTTRESHNDVAPTTGNSSSCSSQIIRHKQRRRTKRRPPSSSSTNGNDNTTVLVIVRALLFIVTILLIFDLILWRFKHHINNNNNTVVTASQSRAQQQQQLRTAADADASSSSKGGAVIDSKDSSSSSSTIADIDHDKEQIYRILAQANVRKEDLDEVTRRRLPTWTQIQSLFGDSPKIYGLDESCERFRTSVESSVKFYGIAGTFNSGTNLLAALLIQNCQITERMRVYGERQKGMRWQVPWGKHTPAHLRETHVTTTDKDVPLENSLPMIAIRDPFVWMQSMCRHPYEAFWDHSKEQCPNLISQIDGELNPVHVDYRHSQTSHESLIHMWNEWYREYMEVPYPRIIVRFEDLLFYGQNVTETLCRCGGGVPRQKRFKHIIKSAKMGTAQHGKDKIGLVDAMIRYGTHKHRLDGLSTEELKKANELLDKELMAIFDYHYADIPIG